MLATTATQVALGTAGGSVEADFVSILGTSLKGSVDVIGDGANSTLTVGDNAATAQTISLTANSVAAPGFGTISYAGIGNLNVEGAEARNTFNIASTATVTKTVVTGNGNDVFNLGKLIASPDDHSGAVDAARSHDRRDLHPERAEHL